MASTEEHQDSDPNTAITLIIATEADVASIGPCKKLLELGGWKEGMLVEVRIELLPIMPRSSSRQFRMEPV